MHLRPASCVYTPMRLAEEKRDREDIANAERGTDETQIPRYCARPPRAHTFTRPFPPTSSRRLRGEIQPRSTAQGNAASGMYS